MSTHYAISFRGHRFARLNDKPFCVYCGWNLDLVDPPICDLFVKKVPGRYSINFTVHALPAMNSARNTHWRAKNKKQREIRDRVALAVCAQGKPVRPLEVVDALLVRYSVSYRTPDPDNLAESFKSVMDELQVQGVLADDTISNFLNGTPTYEWARVKRRKDQAISIRLVEI